ncbi:MAG: ABC transporter substrate-binding protein [Methanosarcinales archaeon]|nr:ABC transporter substrate-binding protein [Methanosarcinales archaeon]
MKINAILAGIAISLLLLVLPAAASDNTLDIFGNANEDGTINMQDVTYTELIILEYKDQTQLADAKYDDRINMQDVTQIELIILGKEKELTVLDGNGKAVTVQKPVERIIVEYLDNAELIRALDAKEKVVGVDFIIAETEIQFPDMSKLPSVGAMHVPDYEAVLSLDPDLLLTFSPATDEKTEKLPNTAVVFLGLYYPDLSDPEGSRFTDGVRKLGYILDAREEAEDYINWRIGRIDDIKSQTEVVSDDEKPRVFVCSYPYPHIETTTFRTYAMVDTLTQMSLMAGGKNIAEDLPEFVQPSYKITVDPEWVIDQNPDFIILHVVRYTYSGMTLDPPHGYDADDPSGLKEGRDAFMSRPELANVNAVKNGNVYILSGTFRNDATGGLVGAAYMAELFHSHFFDDMDPQAIHQEYLTEFQGLDYDLNEHGVFIYPPLEES